MYLVVELELGPSSFWFVPSLRCYGALCLEKNIKNGALSENFAYIFV